MRVSPKRRQLSPVDRIHELASNSVSPLSLDQRNYVVGMSRFYIELAAHYRLLKNIKVFHPFIESIDQIDQTLEECLVWILDYVDDKLEFVDLPHPVVDFAQDLPECLDSAPVLFQSLPRDVPTALEYIFNDLEGLNERLWDRVRDAGYELHHVLIGFVTEVACLSKDEIVAAQLRFRHD